MSYDQLIQVWHDLLVVPLNDLTKWHKKLKIQTSIKHSLIWQDKPYRCPLQVKINIFPKNCIVCISACTPPQNYRFLYLYRQCVNHYCTGNPQTQNQLVHNIAIIQHRTDITMIFTLKEYAASRKKSHLWVRASRFKPVKSFNVVNEFVIMLLNIRIWWIYHHQLQNIIQRFWETQHYMFVISVLSHVTALKQASG